MDNTSNVVERLRKRSRPVMASAGLYEYEVNREPDTLCHEAADTIERLRAELAEAYENAAKVAARRGAEVSEAAKDCGRDYLHDVETVEQRCAYEIAEGIRAMIAAHERSLAMDELIAGDADLIAAAEGGE